MTVKKKAEIYGAMTSVMNLVKEMKGEGDYKGGAYAKDHQVLKAVREALVTADVAFVPSLKSHTVKEGADQKGKIVCTHTVEVVLRFVSVVDTSMVEMMWAGQALSYSDKGLAAAFTNAVKQGLLKMFLVPIVAEEPPDQTGTTITHTRDDWLNEYLALEVRAMAWGIKILEVQEEAKAAEVSTMVNKLRFKIEQHEGYWARFNELALMADDLAVKYRRPASGATLDSVGKAGKILKGKLESATK